MNLSTLKRRMKSRNGMARRIVEFHGSHIGGHPTTGSIWYRVAHEFCKSLAREYDLQVPTVAGVVSALSPSVSWAVNQEDARSLVHAYCIEGKPENCTVSTYGPNKMKAIGILDANDPTYRFTAAPFFMRDTKTNSFYYNLYAPMSSQKHVTVDRHAIGVAVGSTGTLHQGISVSYHRYRTMQDAYRTAADRLDIRYPCELQAECWIAYRTAYVDKRYTLESEYSGAPF